MTAAEKFAELSEAEKRRFEDLETEMRRAKARISGFQSCLDALVGSDEEGGARRRLEDRIAKEESAITELEQQFEEARERLSAFEEALRILEKQGKIPDLRANSMMARVREAMRQVGKAMTLGELAAILNLDKKEKNSVRTSLASYARDGRVFARGEGPETFTLIEFKAEPSRSDGNLNEETECRPRT